MATEITDTIASARLGNERSIWIRPPENAGQAEHLTLFLDGELYRDRIGAESTIDDLLASGRIADSWFVFVSMHSMEARWRECPCYAPFASFIAEEVIQWLETRFPEIRSVRERTLVGVSYTGLAAGYIAIEQPRVFQRVIGQSGSFWWNDCWLAKHCRRTRPQAPTSFYLEVGTRETQENVRHREDVLQVHSQIFGVQQFRDALVERGDQVVYVENPGAAHEYNAWRKSLPEVLLWALGVTERSSHAG